MCYIQTKNFLVYKTQVQMTTHASVSVTNIVLVQHKLVLTSHNIVCKHYSLLFFPTEHKCFVKSTHSSCVYLLCMTIVLSQHKVLVLMNIRILFSQYVPCVSYSSQ